MEPFSSLAVGYATGKLTELVESTIRANVIERWGRHRARQFFEAFCEAVTDEKTSEADLQQRLDDLLSDDRRSEVLFDAYRSVCLTRSKTLGPRVIALLTAELVMGESVADDGESAIFGAAEELSDSELIEFSEFAMQHHMRAKENTKDSCSLTDAGGVRIQWGEETFDSNWHREIEVSLAPLDLANDFGTWAPKLKRHGLLSDDVKERQWDYKEDGERHIDEDGTARQVSWWLCLSSSAIRFAELIQKAR